jgi:hypothetical protein
VVVSTPATSLTLRRSGRVTPTSAPAAKAQPRVQSFAARVDATTFGVNVDGLWNYSWNWSAAARDAHFAAIADSGITSVRAGVVWNEVQSCRPGTRGCARSFDWARHDDWMAALARAGLRADLQLGWSATWASSYFGNQFAPPASIGEFVAYARAVAGRYGRGGEFWRAHPELPYRPATVFEVWNEENEAAWWRPHPDPAAYADLYMATRQALEQADPGAAVIVGGLATVPSSDHSAMADTEFIHQMFTARPALRGQVDGLGYHPYAASTADVLTRVAAVRQALRAVGEPQLPLYITELGWASGNGGPRAAAESARASLLYDTFDALARSDCGIRRIDAYTWVSRESDTADDVEWMGLYNQDATPKAGGRALRQLVELLAGRGPAAPPEATVHVC